MSYIGSTPTTQSFIEGTDYFNGDGSTTAFTLSRSVVSVNDIQATINNVVQQPNTAYTVSGTTITFTSAPSAGTANIYVRYLSTTTQSITPSQNTVSYSTLNSDSQSKLGISFKNRIINGAMVIDQRNAGASVTPTNFTYNLDRWGATITQSSKFTVQQNAGSVTLPVGFTKYLGVTSSSAYSVGSTDRFGIFQAIEGFNAADLGWGTANAKTVTLSFQVYSSLTGTFSGTIRSYSGTDTSYPFTYSIPTANTWTPVSITIVGPTTGTWATDNSGFAYIFFGLGTGSTYNGTANTWSTGNYWSVAGSQSVVGTSGATWYITGVQFEVGTQATTFDYRSYGTELALCQRYCFAPDPAATWVGGMNGTNSGLVTIPFPVQMRTAPSGTISGTWTFDNYTGTGTTTTVLFQNTSRNACRIYPNSLSGISGGAGNQAFEVSPNNVGVLIVSAEL